MGTASGAGPRSIPGQARREDDRAERGSLPLEGIQMEEARTVGSARPGPTGEATGEQVVLVDAADRAIGMAEKLSVHREAKLHRAVSVFVFNAEGALLLQRRAATKYHSAGLWSNTCCSHPRPGEDPLEAARRRLEEEMGLACDLYPVFRFVYRAELGGGLVEHEYDHVFAGWSDQDPRPDPREVAEWRWAAVNELCAEIAERPGDYTPWFRLALPILLRHELPAVRPGRSGAGVP